MVYNWSGQMMNGSWGNWMNVTNYRDAFFGGALGALLMTMVIVFIILIIAVYIYFALAWRAIARKKRLQASMACMGSYCKHSNVVADGRIFMGMDFPYDNSNSRMDCCRGSFHNLNMESFREA